MRQRLYQAKITAGMAGIDNRHPGRRQVRAHFLEKLARSQLEGHIGLLISIDTNLIIQHLRRPQVVASILYNDMQVGFTHMKILLRKLDNRAIDLNPINRNRPINSAKFTRDSACPQPDHSHPTHLALCKRGLVEKRSNQEVVPGALRQHTVRVIDRMDTQPLIQHQLRFITHAHHLNIVVG